MTFGELAIEECGEQDFEIGQRLEGVMIPKIRETIQRVAATGQVAKRKSLIKEGDLGTEVFDDSASVVYAKVISIAIFAAVVSYITVPIMVRILQRILSVFDDKQEL